MRIISHDGTLDMPYEICTVWCRGSVIMCDMCGDNTTKTVLATYSTDKKAQKAMEMLREKYLQYISIQGGESALVQAVFQPNCWVLPKVFQFPAEEELE